MTDIDYLLEGDPRERVTWQRKLDVWGDPVFGSRATIAQLEWTNTLCIDEFGGLGFEVLQGGFNTDVPASAGTHDFDKCIDGFVAGKPLDFTTQRFLRGRCLWFGWLRLPPKFGRHFHLCASHTYQTRVGAFVPGQINDYLATPPKDGLAGDTLDPTWHPDPILRFDYNQWKADQMALTEKEIAAVAQASADKTVSKLLATKLTLSDGSEVTVGQALERAAKLPAQLEAAVPSRNAVMAKLDELDDQVGP
jgi:hypothetical protein